MKSKISFAIGIIFLLSGVAAFAALDLAFVGTINQTPNPATAGATVTFSTSFSTNGGAVTNLRIIGGVDGAQLFTRTYASIGADLTRTDSFTWTAAAGNHTVWFELDPDHACGDSNYANNRIEKAITIGGGSTEKPDLYISNVVSSPVIFVYGKTVTLTITVANKGTADAPATDLFMKNHCQKVLMLHPMPSIPKGGQYVHKIDWIGYEDSELTIKVDTEKKVDELDESNNAWVKKMTCSGIRTYNKLPISDPPTQPHVNMDRPDLTVKIVYQSINGDKVCFQVEVENIGKADSIKCSLLMKIGSSHDVTMAIPALKPGEKYNFWEHLPYKTIAKLIFIVDNQNVNHEMNESNNSAEMFYAPNDPLKKQLPR